jgi:HEAT repeat protein
MVEAQGGKMMTCALALALVLAGCSGVGVAQTTAPQAGDASADGTIVTAADAKPRSKVQLTGDAWELLKGAMADDKHPDIRMQALAALGTMGSNARSTKMIVAAYDDKDVDVRTAAVLATAQTRDRALLPGLHRLLDDREPQVAFTAANTLWRMGDHAGADLLMTVVDGDRKASAGLVHGSMHSANREMHDPAALAKLGATEGASMLLGPFGFGITAYEYMKRNGGDSARVKAVEDISQTRTPDVRTTLLAALRDKDPAVRAAAAKAVRLYHDKDVEAALALLLADSKKPVQYSAAAAYLVCVGAVAAPPAVPLTP